MKRTSLDEQMLETRLQQLPELADQSLAGIEATEALKRRILNAAERPDAVPSRRPARAWVPALALSLALVVGVAVVPALHRDQPDPVIVSQPAGSDAPHADLRAGSDLASGSVTIVNTGAAPVYRSIWEAGENGNFPLIGVRGAYYRMLTTPADVDASLLGESLGTVAEFTTEPSLSGKEVILSNTAACGAEVYAVDGMGGTLIAAEVDGATRLFQRVSFNGNALQGRETLADTLQIAGHIVAMELSDVGVVTDSAVCETLFAALIDNASYDASGAITARQSLLIELDDGLTLQLAVRNDKLSACGTWSCPEFFEAFEDAVQ